MLSAQAENINNSFFDGYYKDVWRALIPEALTKAEVDYLVSEAGLKVGSKVLDLMCGYGRHALSLARQGINVTAVDNLADYISEIKEIAGKENLPVTTLREDVIQFQSGDKYDLVICMGNSMSFFNEEDSEKLFSNICSHLKTNGKVIFNSWMITEIAIKQFKDNFWAAVGDVKCLYNSKYLFSPARIETESTFIAPDGNTEIKKAVDYVYSLNETEAMLNRSGLAVREIWSIPGKKKFVLGEPRIYVVAEKLTI
jgi:cyclopropane fatty-acyl-phospholipid synthase-like methyltransferase